MKLLLTTVTCLALASAAQSATVELQPVQDAYICNCLPDATNPNGGSNNLYFGQYGSCYDRTLIQWDLSSLPAGVNIVSATMMLYCEAFYGTESGNPVYYMINTEWDENTVTFNTQPDYDESQSITGTWPESETWCSVDVLPYATAWLEGTHSNQGIYCFRDGTTGTCVPGFRSSNYSDETLRPRLVIQYEEQDFENSSWGFLKTLTLSN